MLWFLFPSFQDVAYDAAVCFDFYIETTRQTKFVRVRPSRGGLLSQSLEGGPPVNRGGPPPVLWGLSCKGDGWDPGVRKAQAAVSMNRGRGPGAGCRLAFANLAIIGDGV